MTRLLLLGVLLTGCGLQWDDVPGAVLNPSVRPTSGMSLDDWNASVTRAATEWNDAMTELGCAAPFALSFVTSGAHPVRLVPEAEWIWDDGWDGTTTPDGGGGPPGAIEVKASTSDKHAVLLHELGHALGLDHLPREDYGPSALNVSGSAARLQPIDRESAAAILGCGAE